LEPMFAKEDLSPEVAVELKECSSKAEGWKGRKKGGPE